MELRVPGKKDHTLPPIMPDGRTAARYSRAIAQAVTNMTASYEWWIQARYRAALEANIDAGRLPDKQWLEGAQDASPSQGANDLFGELARLRAYWREYFADFAKKLAAQAVKSWYDDNAAQWQGKLKRAGFDIKMQLTPSQKLILAAKVPENVSLITSIPEAYHKDIEGIVLRSFVKGRDLHTMADEIKAKGQVSVKRAAFIARDQSNKATAQMNAARQRELSIRFAVWIHSSAGKEPREKHVRAGRQQWVFDTQVGIDFKDGFGPSLPGTPINCRCISRSIIPSIGRGDIGDFEDLEPVPGFPGAYRVKKGRSAGPKQTQDVTRTRAPAGSPDKYS